MYYLLLLSGDVEINPGPISIDHLNDTSDSSSDILSQALTCHLSIFHMNIQSIVPKMELIKAEADTYDILIFTESWLKHSTPDTPIRIDNYVGPFRADRPDRQGGGVVAYVRETIACRRRPDLEVRGLEALWLEIEINSKNVLVGGFYRAPGSDAAYFDLLKESVDRAYHTNTVDIIITGDFKFNMMSKNMNKLKELILEYNRPDTFYRNHIYSDRLDTRKKSIKCSLQHGSRSFRSQSDPLSLSYHYPTEIHPTYNQKLQKKNMELQACRLR